MLKKILLLSTILLFTSSVNGQILISLLLGDTLNSGKVEFGLDGGVNFATLNGVENAKSSARLNLGFYFDIKMKNDWLLHTGVIVKSTMGTSGLKTYPLNNSDLDNAFSGGEVKRNLEYFNVPLMLKHNVYEQFFAEGGVQFGLLYKAKDEFTNSINEDKDLNYKVDIKNQYHPLDAGLVVGIGYRLMGGNGMNLGIRYYYGFVDIEVDDTNKNSFNRSLYCTLGIPIGAGKAKQKQTK